jgi:glyoxylase-like metal-dependent hydrolase (beta-lactamase superfamily II)
MKKACINSGLFFLVLANITANSVQGKGPGRFASTTGDTSIVAPPGYYPIIVGSFTVTALNDGTLLLPLDHLMKGAAAGELGQALTKYHRSLPTETSVNCFLINMGGKLILVDAGGGDVYRSGGLGNVLQSLARAGYKPEQIDAVLITHFHADHTGGLSKDGEALFPNADVYINQADYDMLFGAAARQVSEVDNVAKLLAPYKDAGRIRTFSKRQELFSGITAIPAPGHTPGHSCYLVGAGKKKMLIWGDIVHASEIQFADPSPTLMFDGNPGQARDSRKALFADAAKNGYRVAGAHISFPGVGYVDVDGSRYRWTPIAYSTNNKTFIFK